MFFAHAAWVLVPLVASGVLVVSGISKIRTAEATQAAMEQFGLPAPLRSRAASLALPWVEIALGVGGLLLGGLAGRVVFGLQVLLYLVFTALVARVVVRGDQMSCQCFGSLSEAPVSKVTVVRNIGFTILSLLAFLLVGAGSVPERLIRFTPGDWGWLAGLVACVGVVFVVNLVTGRTRDERAVAVARRELAVKGQLLTPPVMLTSPDGEAIKLTKLAATKPLLLVMVSPTCGACHKAIESAPTWQQRVGETVQIVLISIRAFEDFFAAYPEPGVPVYTIDWDDRVVLGLHATPSGILVGSNGKLASGVINGTAMIGLLIDDLEVLARL